MNDLLEWISRNGGAAFGLAIFCIIVLGAGVRLMNDFYNFLLKLARAFTGKYPPPDPPDNRPIVKCDGNCDCNKPCKCCVEDCQVGCECSSMVDE